MTTVMDPPPQAAAMAALAGLDAALDEVASVGLWSLGDAQLLEFRRLAGELANRLAGLLHTATGEISVRGATHTVAQVPTTGWLTDALGHHPGAAAREVRLAAALRTDLPTTATTLSAGRIGVAAAEVIADTDRALTRFATAAQRGDAEALLAEHAPGLGVRGLQRAALHLQHRLDPDAGDRLAADEADQRQARTLDLAVASDGTSRGRFILDKEATAALTSVLDPLSKPRGGAVLDPRSPNQRRADALAEVLDHALRCPGATPGLDPAGAGDRPARPAAQLTVTVSLATLQRRLAAPAGHIDHGLPLSAEAVRRLACDAAVLPIVLGGASQPLDVGRAAKTVPQPMRRALIARDGGCAFPGCDRPASWCDAHHIQHWADGGRTSLSNLVLLCRRHHRTIHHHGWTVHIADDALPEFVPPAWIRPDQPGLRHIRHTPTARGDP